MPSCQPMTCPDISWGASMRSTCSGAMAGRSGALPNRFVPCWDLLSVGVYINYLLLCECILNFCAVASLLSFWNGWRLPLLKASNWRTQHWRPWGYATWDCGYHVFGHKIGIRVVGTKRLAWGKLKNRKLQVNMFNGQAVCDRIYFGDFGANLGDRWRQCIFVG